MIQHLEGVRVLECAALVQGGHAGRGLVGELGATVVKVENPEHPAAPPLGGQSDEIVGELGRTEVAGARERGIVR